MAKYGLLVIDWPLVLGVDASGVVVEAGAVARDKYKFSPGDYVCGCTRLGMKGYSTAQEHFLMDAPVTIPKPKNLSLMQAATLGVGAQTAALGLFEGLNISLPDPGNLPDTKDEWIVILGGASSVGKAAIQLARCAGFQVMASCSTKSSELVERLGAASFDYKEPVDDQVSKIMSTTAGNVSRCFDAVAADDPITAKELFKVLGSKQGKMFATTNDWSGIKDFEGGKTYCIELGPIGQPGAASLNAALEQHIPVIVKLVEAGKLQTPEFQVVGDGGFDDLVKAYHHHGTGAGGSNKVIVKIQDE